MYETKNQKNYQRIKMSRLKIKETIEKEEFGKIKPVLIALIGIFCVALVVGIFLRIPTNIKFAIWLVLFVAVIALLVRWGLTYYKK